MCCCTTKFQCRLSFSHSPSAIYLPVRTVCFVSRPFLRCLRHLCQYLSSRLPVLQWLPSFTTPLFSFRRPSPWFLSRAPGTQVLSLQVRYFRICRLQFTMSLSSCLCTTAVVRPLTPCPLPTAPRLPLADLAGCGRPPLWGNLSVARFRSNRALYTVCISLQWQGIVFNLGTTTIYVQNCA